VLSHPSRNLRFDVIVDNQWVTFRYDLQEGVFHYPPFPWRGPLQRATQIPLLFPLASRSLSLSLSLSVYVVSRVVAFGDEPGHAKLTPWHFPDAGSHSPACLTHVDVCVCVLRSALIALELERKCIKVLRCCGRVSTLCVCVCLHCVHCTNHAFLCEISSKCLF